MSNFSEYKKVFSLLENPTLKIMCPRCNNTFLNVMDVYIAGSNQYERIINCKSCDFETVALGTNLENKVWNELKKKTI